VKYMLLLVNAPDAWNPPDRRSGTADDAVIDDWATYTRALEAAGVLIDGAGRGAGRLRRSRAALAT